MKKRDRRFEVTLHGPEGDSVSVVCLTNEELTTFRDILVQMKENKIHDERYAPIISIAPRPGDKEWEQKRKMEQEKAKKEIAEKIDAALGNNRAFQTSMKLAFDKAKK